MKWLVTAFAPFAGATSNSSLEVAKRLCERDWGGRVEFQFPLPVTFADAFSSLKNVAEFDGVLALGQAESRAKISLERVALNFADAAIADNAGFKPTEQKLLSDGPDLFWSPIAWPKFKRPANVEISYSAGTFVCNALLYQMLQTGLHAGFVHIPLLEAQGGKMPEDQAVSSVVQILEFLI